jgi:hypothetical protein
VAAWRGFRDLGALVLGPTVCVVPAAVARDRAFEQTVDRIRAAGGSVETLTVAAFEHETDASLRERYNARRDGLYQDVARRAATLLRRMESELGEGAVGFDRLERHEVDLAGLRRAIRKIAAGDCFDARGRLGAMAAVDQAAAALDAFAREAIRQEGVRRDGAVGAALEPLLAQLDDAAEPIAFLSGRLPDASHRPGREDDGAPEAVAPEAASREPAAG